MAALVCPFCKSLANFTEMWKKTEWRPNTGPSYSDTERLGLAALECNNSACRFVVVGLQTREGIVLKHWPEVVAGKEFPDVPPQIAATASDAHVCLSAGSPRGAVALARAVVEAAAKDHGITEGTLWSKIEQMAQRGIVSQPMASAAHEIRFAGNEVAHGDLVEEELTEEDATDILSLMDAFLHRIYQEPVQVARVTTRRTERTGSGTGSSESV